MKIIDLLNKIANGEEVPKFWWNGCIHQIEKDYNGNCSIFDTYCKKYKKIELNQLNDEVKIIEEDKKIEILNCDYIVPNTPANENEAYIMSCLLAHELKINEIIEAINGLKKGE